MAADTPDGPFHAIGNEVAFLVSHIEGFYIAAVGPDGGARVLDVLGPGEWNDLTIMGSTGDALFFRRGGKLYRTDGTRAGTREIAVDHSVSKLVAVGGHVAIAGWSFERDGELSILAPGALRATVLDESSEFMRAIDGRLYYANRQGLRSWAPGEFVRTVDAHAPAEGSFGVEFAKLGDQLVYVVSAPPGRGAAVHPGHRGRSASPPTTSPSCGRSATGARSSTRGTRASPAGSTRSGSPTAPRRARST